MGHKRSRESVSIHGLGFTQQLELSQLWARPALVIC